MSGKKLWSGPSLGFLRLPMLAMALTAPATSVYLTFGTTYQIAGPGVIGSFALGAGLALLVMLSYAELGSLVPGAGGDYALASQTVGVGAGRVVGGVFLLKGALLPAVLVTTAAAYLHDGCPGIPVVASAAGMLLVIVGLTLVDLDRVSRLVSALVAIELAGFGWFVLRSLQLIERKAPHAFAGLGIPRHPVAILAAAVPILYSLNGPQGVLYYREEIRDRPQTYGRAVVTVALVTICVELVGFVLGVLAVSTTGGSAPGLLPLVAVISGEGSGPPSGSLLLASVIVGLFNAALATVMSYGRVYFAMARNELRRSGLRHILTCTDRRGAPAASLAIVGVLNLVSLLLFPVQRLIVLLGSLVMVVFGIISLGALLMRRKFSRPPYRMPGWPWPPILALVGLMALLPFIPVSELVVMAGVIALSLLWPR